MWLYVICLRYVILNDCKFQQVFTNFVHDTDNDDTGGNYCYAAERRFVVHRECIWIKNYQYICLCSKAMEWYCNCQIITI